TGSSSILNRGFLSRIWGGRHPGGRHYPDNNYLASQNDRLLTNPDAGSDLTSSPSFDKFRNPRAGQGGEVFHISDPARGLVSYTRAEFEQQWLSRAAETGEEGVALLL